jgi:hypothetical protein
VSTYHPIAVATRMGDYGYWVVTVSVAPGRRIDVTIGSVGITREVAAELAVASLPELPVRRVPWQIPPPQ